MNICLLEVAMCEKCRSSHFQSEGEIKSLRTGRELKNFRTGGGYRLRSGGTFAEGVSAPLNAMFWQRKALWHHYLGKNNCNTDIGQYLKK